MSRARSDAGLASGIANCLCPERIAKDSDLRRSHKPAAEWISHGWHQWDGLYVGRRKGDDLVYAGKIDHGFDKASTAELRRRLEPLVRKTQPYAKRIAHKGVWVEPKLLADIEYRAKSAEGKVWHPFFRGLREDL